MSLGTLHYIKVCSLPSLAFYTRAVITAALQMGIVWGPGSKERGTDARAAETFHLFIIIVLCLGTATEQSPCSVPSVDFDTAYGLRRVTVFCERFVVSMRLKHAEEQGHAQIV